MREGIRGERKKERKKGEREDRKKERERGERRERERKEERKRREKEEKGEGGQGILRAWRCVLADRSGRRTCRHGHSVW